MLGTCRLSFAADGRSAEAACYSWPRPQQHEQETACARSFGWQLGQTGSGSSALIAKHQHSDAASAVAAPRLDVKNFQSMIRSVRRSRPSKRKRERCKALIGDLFAAGMFVSEESMEAYIAELAMQHKWRASETQYAFSINKSLYETKVTVTL
eukprot:TRINITY_DN67570_c0_g1_i1.p1 TRINITY_DN67570_c0_g1~~TRINITY_DN67570_c0_g1_i1.p1  ORF type:complete len:153 (+),score=22.93 TRINITY_DN67570_c0_g1_i1:81-539(+)